MVSPEMNPTICWMFEAEIVLLFHAKTFHKGFQVTVHTGNVRQTATVVAVRDKVGSFSQTWYGCTCWLFTLFSMPFLFLFFPFMMHDVTQEELRTGEKAVVLFKFIKHPEYLKVGAQVLFREGLSKGIGHVTKLQPITQYQPSHSGYEEA